MAQLSVGSHPSELNYSQMVQSPIIQISNYPTVLQSSCPKSNCPDFQTCNVRFIESDGKAQRDSCAKDERTGSGMVVDPKICL